MHANNTTVKPGDVRPARRDGTCFYCRQPVGGEHNPDCVILDRSVVMRFSFELVVCAPAIMNQSQLEFKYNEGSWCADNLLRALRQYKAKNGCLCSAMQAEYVREATAEDHEAQSFEFDPTNDNGMLGKVVAVEPDTIDKSTDDPPAPDHKPDAVLRMDITKPVSSLDMDLGLVASMLGLKEVDDTLPELPITREDTLEVVLAKACRLMTVMSEAGPLLIQEYRGKGGGVRLVRQESKESQDPAWSRYGKLWGTRDEKEQPVPIDPCERQFVLSLTTRYVSQFLRVPGKAEWRRIERWRFVTEGGAGLYPTTRFIDD